MSPADACSLMGLDDIGLEPCVPPSAEELAGGDAPDPCRALNELHGLSLEKDCEVYQCRADRRACALREQDRDGDGVPSLLCNPAGDCDDSNALSAPGLAERCDGFDNDCDGEIDEALRWELDGPAQRMGLEGELVPSATTLRDGRLLVLDVQRTGAIDGVVFDGAFSDASILVPEPLGYCGPDLSLKCKFSSARAIALSDQLILSGFNERPRGTSPLLFARFPDPVPAEERYTWQAPALDEACALEDAARVGVPSPAPTLAADAAQRMALAAWSSADRLNVALVASDEPLAPPLLSTESLPAPAASGEAAIAAVGDGFVLAYAASDQECAGIALTCVTRASSAVELCACLGVEGAESPAFAAPALDDHAVASAPLALAWREAGELWFAVPTPAMEPSAFSEVSEPVRVDRAGEALGTPLLMRVGGGTARNDDTSRFLLLWAEACPTGACTKAAVMDAHGGRARVLTSPYALTGLDGAAHEPFSISQHGEELLLLLGSPGEAVGAQLVCIDEDISQGAREK